MKRWMFSRSLILIALFLASCSVKTAQDTEQITSNSSLLKSSFGNTRDGIKIDRYTLRNENGLEMSVINYGGIITSLIVPDKKGVFEDIVLGFDSLADYEKEHPYFGALIGRFGNRIAKGRFTLDGNTYTLAKNNGENHLHGGVKGFDKVVWTMEEISSSEGKAVKLAYLSKDMEEGYPGNLSVEVVYTLTDNNELKIDYKASTDKKTVINLTQHSYFNLSGNVKTDILGHELTIYANTFLPVDATLIPTGTATEVTNTPFDFREPNLIGSRINGDDQQLKFGLGYDHCWIINPADEPLRIAARLYDPQTGRQVEVETTEPGMQFYSGNFLDGSLTGKNGVKYVHRSGLCLETQHFPDSPNQPQFPSVELSPGETYQSQTVFRFSTK